MIRTFLRPFEVRHESFIAIISKQLDGSGVTANVLIPGGATNTNFISDADVRDRDALIQPIVMRAPIVWLASNEADGTTGRRIIASKWDEGLPIEQRLEGRGGARRVAQLGRPAAEQGRKEHTMTTNPHDELQEAALNHLWMPTQDWSDLAENGVTFMDEGDGVRIRSGDGQMGL